MTHDNSMLEVHWKCSSLPAVGLYFITVEIWSDVVEVVARAEVLFSSGLNSRVCLKCRHATLWVSCCHMHLAHLIALKCNKVFFHELNPEE